MFTIALVVFYFAALVAVMTRMAVRDIRATARARAHD